MPSRVDPDAVLAAAEPVIQKLAKRLLRRRPSADLEDAMQEARIAVWTQATRFDPARGDLGAFIYRVVHNRLLDYRDHLTAKKRQSAALPADIPLPDTAGADALIQQLIQQPRTLLSEVKATLFDALMSTPNRSSLAARLGITPDVADRRVNRLSDDLRALV
jgi:RNA polymerase sigma-70 factor (ECF subfamily)